MKNRIFIVDDHPLIRTGLRVEIQNDPSLVFVGEAGSIQAAIRSMDFKKADLMVCDISLSDENGIEELDSIKRKFSELKVIFLTMHRDWAYLQKAFQSGAEGYILKSESMQNILESIKKVLNGEKVFPNQAEPLVPKSDFLANVHGKIKLLTKRELEILELLANGKMNREIGEEFGISIRTVESHRGEIMRKLQIKNAVELGQIIIRLRESGLSINQGIIY
ncbi:DNA-binding response regulator [Leptospira langatensis]|uniref:DNA-binding response regulator n=1 Tax=Leptospira langatensis TaxID=2484983 RepID=A0A5F1ZRY7_9LEPT|nr:response regulator transcription factor [Leptospira langatensis]TGK02542.1 DNA-binding response regulator [Leptospira langatensis]TGL40257.1 DNA-binding response regulator [Leptospira langatensis]